MAEQTKDLGMEDLLATSRELRERMESNDQTTQLFQQVLTLLEKCSNTLEELSMSHNTLVKSVSRLRAAQERQESFSEGLTKSFTYVIRALQGIDLPRASRATANGHVQKSWPVAVPDRTADPEPEPVVESPQEMVKKGMLLQAVSRVFGPKGGRAVPYNSTQAGQMLLDGTLTKSEHRAWKTLGRLPDHVKLAS